MVPTQLSTELLSSGAAQRQRKGAVTSRLPDPVFLTMGLCSLLSHMAVSMAGHRDSSSLILTLFPWSHQTQHHLQPVCPIIPPRILFSVFPCVSLMIRCTNVQHLHSISPLQNYSTFIFKIQHRLKVLELHKAFGQAAAEQHCHVLNTLESMSLFTISLNPRLVIKEKNHRIH